MIYFSGMTPLEPFIAYQVSHSEEVRRDYLEQLARN